MMLIKQTIYCIMIFTVFFTAVASAQCHIKKSKNGNIITAENPEDYIYQRSAQNYDGLSIRSLYIKQAGKKKYQLKIYYTSNLTDTVQQFKFKALDSTEIAAPVKLFGLKKNDNKKLNTKIYKTELTDGLMEYLTKHPIASILADRKTNARQINIEVTDASFLINQIACLLSN